MSLFLFEDEPRALFLPWPDLSPSLLWSGGKPGHRGQGTRSRTPVLHPPRSAWPHSQLRWQRQGWGPARQARGSPGAPICPVQMGRHRAWALGSQQVASGAFSRRDVALGCFRPSITSRSLASVKEAATPALIIRVLFACCPGQLSADPAVQTPLTAPRLPEHPPQRLALPCGWGCRTTGSRGRISMLTHTGLPASSGSKRCAESATGICSRAGVRGLTATQLLGFD